MTEQQRPQPDEDKSPNEAIRESLASWREDRQPAENETFAGGDVAE